MVPVGKFIKKLFQIKSEMKIKLLLRIDLDHTIPIRLNVFDRIPNKEQIIFTKPNCNERVYVRDLFVG